MTAPLPRPVFEDYEAIEGLEYEICKLVPLRTGVGFVLHAES
jgi:hypothetical protein